jgi:hypothetical protein
MVTSAIVSFVSCLDACLDAVGVRPPFGYLTILHWIHDENESTWSRHVSNERMSSRSKNENDN